MDFNKLKNFDWRSLKKYASAQSSDDINRFLEKLPQNTNKTLLVITGIVWAVAGVLGLYTTLQMQSLTSLRAELQEMQAVKPMVPILETVDVNRQDVEMFVKRTKDIYKNLSMQAKGASITLDADNTIYFGQFREALGHVQNGGSGWRVQVQKLCVGRECGSKKLTARLSINKISVDKPS